jgi:LysM repeat protein
LAKEAAEPLYERAILAAMTDPSEPTEKPTEEPSPPESIDTAGSVPDTGDAATPGPHAVDPRAAASATIDEPADPLVPAAGLPRAAVVATAAGAAAAVPARPIPTLAGRRQFARTTPVVIDRGRASFGFPSFGDRRQLGQIGLVVLMVAALGAILLARIGQPQTPGVTGSSPSIHASAHSSAKASPHPTITPGPTPGSSTTTKSPGPSPSSKPRTYKVQAGDTLSSIAAKFKTTAKAIEQLNNIQSPFVIHPGEVLKLP